MKKKSKWNFGNPIYDKKKLLSLVTNLFHVNFIFIICLFKTWKTLSLVFAVSLSFCLFGFLLVFGWFFVSCRMFSITELNGEKTKPKPAQHQCMMEPFTWSYMFLSRMVVFPSMLLLSEPFLTGGRFFSLFFHVHCDSVLQVYQETPFMTQGLILLPAKQIWNSQLPL